MLVGSIPWVLREQVSWVICGDATRVIRGWVTGIVCRYMMWAAHDMARIWYG